MHGNDAGQKSRVHNSDSGITAEYEYDALGRLRSVGHFREGTTNPLFKIEYTLAPDGNRIGATETRDDNVVTWHYRYDPLGRLVREHRIASSNPVERNYTYDADSNRTSVVDELDEDESSTYSYEPNSQRLAEITYADGRRTEFDWNDNGQRSAEREYDAHNALVTQTNYTWGLDGTLASVEKPGAHRVEYGYDHTGALVRRIVHDLSGGGSGGSGSGSGSTDNILSDEKYLVADSNLTGYSQILAVINGQTGTVGRFHTFSDDFLAQTDSASAASSSTLYPATDGLKSIRALASDGTSSGDVTSFNYNAFGNRIGDLPTNSTSKYAFTGQMADNATSLQNHRARWYDRESEGWISSDLAFDFPKNQGHAYAYAGSNPIIAFDLTGAFTLTELLVVVAAISILVTSFISARQLYSDTDGSFAKAALGFVASALIGALYVFAMYYFAASSVTTMAGLGAVLAVLEYSIYSYLRGDGPTLAGIILTGFISFIVGWILGGVGAMLLPGKVTTKTMLTKEYARRPEIISQLRSPNSMIEQGARNIMQQVVAQQMRDFYAILNVTIGFITNLVNTIVATRSFEAAASFGSSILNVLSGAGRLFAGARDPFISEIGGRMVTIAPFIAF